MLKKVFLICILALSNFLYISSNVYANAGPPTMLEIKFEGLGTDDYFITLLGDIEGYQYDSDGYYNENSVEEDFNNPQNYRAAVAFDNYEDVDDFKFTGVFSRSYNNIFETTDVPPDPFKVLLYFPESESFLISEEYYSYGISSYYVATLSENMGELSVTPTVSEPFSLQAAYDYPHEIYLLIVRMLLTIVVELIIAFFFGFKGEKIFLSIVAINIITQILLNVILNSIVYFGWINTIFFSYLFLELLIVIVETLLLMLACNYIKTNKHFTFWKILLYSSFANLVSFTVGIILSLVF